MIIDICDNLECTGCFACMNICPVNAITITKDKLKKTMPQINSNLCISCKLCKKVCPVNNFPNLNKSMRAYAAWSKDKIDQQLSSSGGIATVFSKFIIQNNGTVFGSAYIDNKNQYFCVENASDIEKLRGSKYVQSDIEYIYRVVKKKLEEGKKSLFIGTPCLVSGLKAYLMKDYDKLLTVDLICHGMPPQDYLIEHINFVTGSKDWSNVTFRGKYDYYLTVWDKENNIIYQQDKRCDEYLAAFMSSINLRDNCYRCKYSSSKRVSDITIGDFWGLDKDLLNNKYNGKISLILINSDKGYTFFKQCRDDLIWEERPLREAFNDEQSALIHPPKISKERMWFEKKYPQMGFDRTIRWSKLGYSIKKFKLRRNLKRLLKVK